MNVLVDEIYRSGNPVAVLLKEIRESRTPYTVIDKAVARAQESVLILYLSLGMA